MLRTVYFAGVDGVRLAGKKDGWRVQIQPNYDNKAPDESWTDVPGGLFPTQHQAEMAAPEVVPESHVF